LFAVKFLFVVLEIGKSDGGLTNKPKLAAAALYY
jgi:hypothetical protein